MFTVCSKCNLRLTVTATDLRAAQGYVRCGRCHNVFNALAALADEPARPPEAAATSDTQSRLALTPPPEPPVEEPAAPQPAAEPEPPVTEDTSLEFNPASTNIYEVFIEATPGDHRTGTFETIVLVGEEPAAAPAPAAAVIAPEAPTQSLTATPVENEAAVDVARERDSPAEPDPTPTPATPEATAAELVAEAVAAAPAQTAATAIPAVETPAVAITPDAAPVAAISAMPAEPLADAVVPATVGAALVSEPSGADEPASEMPPAATAATAATDATAADILEAIAALDAPAPAAPSAAAPFLDARAADEIVSAMEGPAPPLGAEPPASRVPRWALPGACVALALCLIGQVVHHYRSELADTAVLRRPLTGLYQALGQPLAVRWDIMNYEIRQLGAGTEGAAAGDLVVRASISNRATRDQPLPLLRVVMQDRFGNRVAARDLAPTEYLGRGAPQVSLMAPGQRVDVQVAFQDPGQTATGFEIDACMASRDHSVTCANDPGSH